MKTKKLTFKYEEIQYILQKIYKINKIHYLIIIIILKNIYVKYKKLKNELCFEK